MMLVKCACHLIGHAVTGDAVVAEGRVIVAVGAAESVVSDAGALEQFCARRPVDEHVVGVVAGLDFVTAVAELEFQYLQGEKIEK